MLFPLLRFFKSNKHCHVMNHTPASEIMRHLHAPPSQSFPHPHVSTSSFLCPVPILASGAARAGPRPLSSHPHKFRSTAFALRCLRLIPPVPYALYRAASSPTSHYTSHAEGSSSVPYAQQPRPHPPLPQLLHLPALLNACLPAPSLAHFLAAPAK